MSYITQLKSLESNRTSNCFHNAIVLKALSLSIENPEFITFCKEYINVSNQPFPLVIAEFGLSVVLSHYAIQKNISAKDNLFALLELFKSNENSNLKLNGFYPLQKLLNQAKSIDWLKSDEAAKVSWDFILFNMLFSNIIGSDPELARVSIQLIQFSKQENFIQHFHIELYSKLQIALSLGLINSKVREDAIRLFKLFAHPKSPAITSSTALVSFFGNSKSLVPLAIALNCFQTEQNWNLFGKYLKKITDSLQDATPSFQELFLLSHTLLQMNEKGGNVPEILNAAVKLYKKTLRNDGDELTAEIGGMSIRIMNNLVLNHDLNIISYWKYMNSIWNSNYEKRGQVLNPFILILPQVTS